MSLFMPDFIWLATGSKQNLKYDLMKPLKNREVILFPDKGEFDVWQHKANKLLEKGFAITVSSLLEDIDEAITGSDLADLYLH